MTGVPRRKQTLQCEALEDRQLLAGNFLSATGSGATGAVFDVRGVTTDSAGNVYEVGTFGNIGSTATFGAHTINCATTSAIFVAKFSTKGVCQWATAVDPGSPLSEYQGSGIVIDGLGRVDIVGSLTGSGIPSSIVVAQLNRSTGAILWAHVFGGPDNAGSSGAGIAAEPIRGARGSLLDITGAITGTISFGNPVTSPGVSDLFVGQLTEAGTPVWGKALPIPITELATGSGITVDNARSDIFVVGTLATVAPITSALLVAEYHSSGTFVSSATPLGFSPNSAGTGIAVDRMGHIYATGASTGAVAVKLSEATLGTIWSRNVIASGSAGTFGVAVDGSGNPYVTGTIGGTINFGSGVLTSAGSSDVFVAKLKPANGLARWSDAGGGAGPDMARGIAFDIRTDRFYAVGDDTPPAKFGAFRLGAKGATNVFLASLK